MKAPRIVSLVPSVTEILFELGVGERIVGVSHQCRIPASAATRPPALTSRRVFPESADGGGEGVPASSGTLPSASAAIDAAYGSVRARAGQPYALDTERLDALAPDVIFDQGICDVCAIGEEQVGAAAQALIHVPELVTITVSTLEGILESIRTIGDAAGVPARAEALVARLQERIDAVVQATKRAAERPRVFCMEWLDPVWCAGHWVPEMVDLAGGEDRLGQRGAPSVRCAWEEVVAWAPEVLVLVPCSFSVAQTLAEAPLLAQRPGWTTLPAVQHGRVWAAESGCFSHHSHRTIEGLEMLAHAFHPELLPPIHRMAPRWPADRLVRLARAEVGA